MLFEWLSSYLQTYFLNNSNFLSMVLIFINTKAKFSSTSLGVKIENMLPLPFSFSFFLSDCERKQRRNMLCAIGRVWSFLIQCKYSELTEIYPESYTTICQTLNVCFKVTELPAVFILQQNWFYLISQLRFL